MTLTVNRPASCLDDHDLAPIYGVHRALRHQHEALRRAIRATDPTDPTATAQVRAWFELTDPAVRLHHHVVEHRLVPAVVDVAPELAPYVRTIAPGNAEVRAHLDQVTAHLSGLAGLAALGASAAASWQHQDTVAAVDALASAVHDQLERERATLLSSVREVVSRTHFDELRAELVVRADPALLPFLFPWLTAGASCTEEARLVTQLPRLLALAHRMVWAPNYERTYPLLVAAGRAAC